MTTSRTFQNGMRRVAGRAIVILCALGAGACAAPSADEVQVSEEDLTTSCEKTPRRWDVPGAPVEVEVYYTSCGDNWRVDTIYLSSLVHSDGGYYAPVIRRYSGPNYAPPLVITWQASAQWLGDTETAEWHPNWMVSKSLNPYVYGWNTATRETSGVARLH